MLELRNVKKKYQSNPVIDIPLAALEKGIYWLKGANGSGKTTLLKLVAGLLPFDGDIRVNNISIKGNAIAYRQLVSWAEAEPLFPAFMSGSSLVGLYLDIKKATRQDARSLIDRFEMHSYIDHLIGTYSAGMIKKLSLLLAFIHKPALIILDEPLITLDADAVKIISDLILENNKDHNCSFLMSSHQDLQEEVSVAGRIIRINNTTITTE